MTIPINPLYIPLFSIEEILNNKDTGLPLSNGTVSFFRDSQQGTPKSVYKLTGSSPSYTFADMGAVLTLGISGTFVDDNGDPFVPYAYPYTTSGALDLYYVVVESEDEVAQFTRNAVPYTGSGEVTPESRINTENELSNPQFVEVNFPAGVTTLTLTGSNTVTAVAPGWDLITSGSDTVTLERLEPTDAEVPTNPPYALSILAGSGFGSSVTLRQRLLNSPGLLRGSYVSGTLTARVISGGGTAISMSYAPSTGTATTIIASTAISTDGAYHPIKGNALIDEQANAAASTGYVDINVVIPTSRSVAITSLQIVGTATSIDVPFDEQTADRQKDHLFHYYEDAAVHQPKSNLLTGWTFGLNPWQFRTTSNSNVATNTYTADQTIVIQQNYVNSAVGNNISVARGTAAQNYAFNVRAVTATNKFALLQYIDPSTIRPYWGQTLSVMLRGSLILGAGHTTTPQFKVRLIYRDSLPATTAQAVPVSSWTNVDNSIPGLAGWTYITPVNDPTYTLTSTAQNFAFDGFDLPASSSNDMTLGIMVIMMNNLNQAATADQLLFDRVSLVHSDFAVDAAPETWDESLRKCQFYYEKSYDTATLPAALTYSGSLQFDQICYYNGSIYIASTKPFYFNFKNVKRTSSPTMTFYNPENGGSNQFETYIYVQGPLAVTAQNPQANAFSTYYTIVTTTANGLSADIPSSVPILAQTAALGSVPRFSAQNYFHYTADARLGI